MRYSIGVMCAALIGAGCCGAALSWDGSGYLFVILDSQAPFVPYGRLVNIILHQPVLIVSDLTQNLTVLRAVFGLTYAMIPIGCLILCWWIVRRRAPWLYVWVCFYFALGVLPGQFAFVYEGVYVSQLAWPVFLAGLVGAPSVLAGVIVFIAVASTFTHPAFSVMLMSFAAVAIVVAKGVRSLGGLTKERWFLLCVLVAGLALFRLPRELDPLHASYLTVPVLVSDFQRSVMGLPLAELICAIGAATLLFVASASRLALFGGRARAIYGAEGALIGAAGVFMVVWGWDAYSWTAASGYRFFAPVMSMFSMALASLEWRMKGERQRQWREADLGHRKHASSMMASVFAIVLVGQTLGWVRLTKDLRDEMAETDWGCVSADGFTWLTGDPLVSSAVYSILVQSRSPRSVVLGDDGCSGPMEDQIPLETWINRSWTKGWFNLESLRDRILSESPPGVECWYEFSKEWWDLEGTQRDWWRWTGGSGGLRVVLPEPAELAVAGRLRSIRQPNRIQVLLNGKPTAEINVDWEGMDDFLAAVPEAQAGENVVEFRSDNAGIRVENDNRVLAFALSNVEINVAGSGTPCELHP